MTDIEMIEAEIDRRNAVIVVTNFEEAPAMVKAIFTRCKDCNSIIPRTMKVCPVCEIESQL